MILLDTGFKPVFWSADQYILQSRLSGLGFRGDKWKGWRAAATLPTAGYDQAGNVTQYRMDMYEGNHSGATLYC